VRYRFTVSNDGAVDLVNVHVNDLTGIADCDSSMTGPAGFTGALAAGANVAFTCNHTMGASALVNTANAAGSYTPPGGGSVDVTSSNDSASVDVVPGPRNPAIAIDKTGPATATAGSAVTYVLTVTNPGNVPFNETALSVTDAQCNGAPVTLTGKGSDASPGSLDPGDAWTYSCSVQTAATDTAIHNVATVAATDPAGTSASATDDADTALTAPTAAAPGTTPGDQLVLGARIVPGRAQLLGPTGCAAKAFNARVRGTKISSVTIKLDGKVVKRFKNVGSKTVAYRIDPSKLRIGVHRLVATITFQKGSGTKPKTMRLSFQRCSKKLVAPRFTG
jgi:uncharacterized repeat protein (TIGR01451 family)